MLAFSEGLLLAERDGVAPALASQVMTASLIGSPMLKLRAPLVLDLPQEAWFDVGDRKSTRLNSSHLVISYAVFCLKKKNITRPSLPLTSIFAIRFNPHSAQLYPSRMSPTLPSTSSYPSTRFTTTSISYTTSAPSSS